MNPGNHKHDFWLTLLRGLVGRCPNCGQGKIFRSYLKPTADCNYCGEKLGHIRADDGPAWLTILIVGHILGPILLVSEVNSSWPTWVAMLVWPGLALILALLVLPRAKGMFMAIIWRAGCVGAEL